MQNLHTRISSNLDNVAMKERREQQKWKARSRWTQYHHTWIYNKIMNTMKMYTEYFGYVISMCFVYKRIHEYIHIYLSFIYTLNLLLQLICFVCFCLIHRISELSFNVWGKNCFLRWWLNSQVSTVNDSLFGKCVRLFMCISEQFFFWHAKRWNVSATEHTSTSHSFIQTRCWYSCCWYWAAWSTRENRRQRRYRRCMRRIWCGKQVDATCEAWSQNIFFCRKMWWKDYLSLIASGVNSPFLPSEEQIFLTDMARFAFVNSWVKILSQ